MQYHASLITADGAYHCPVGSIMAIFKRGILTRRCVFPSEMYFAKKSVGERKKNSDGNIFWRFFAPPLGNEKDGRTYEQGVDETYNRPGSTIQIVHLLLTYKTFSF